MEIFHDKDDLLSCLELLYYLNDIQLPHNWKRDLKNTPFLYRPEHWPARSTYTDILCFCIHSNHIHLLLKEKLENGISRFMRGFPNSLTQRYNEKYGGAGSIFQGSYKNRKIENDADLHNVALYIMAKNVMERFPEGGITGAAESFEQAWAWASDDTFSSFPAYAAEKSAPLLQKEILAERFSSSEKFYSEVKNYLDHYISRGFSHDLVL